ncbi:MAG: AAA family ATPase [Ardenticatenaceae bacterium]|nr:AAA family ATPase [Ardenticatenaceae bacterium]MCB9446133.1 AAA family ATPase [Ardenticatenaceae bacterium]
MPFQIGQRIVVIGTTGSGKTTLARQLAQKLELTHVEIDSLHWGPDWIPVPDDAFRQRIREALPTERWVIDGNYRKVRDIIWPRAEAVIWLDYPLVVVLWRLLCRAIRRTARQEILWSGNRETWRKQFFSRESLFLWAPQTHPRHRREYPVFFARPEHAHLQIVHLRSVQQTKKWMDRVTAVVIPATNLPTKT